MTKLKTKPTKKSVEQFLKKVENSTKREDSFKILKLMKEVTNEEPVMWGESIVGFGSYHYTYASGREGDWPLVEFSPRKQNLTLNIVSVFEGYDKILKNLGKFKTGKFCLYINKLEDVDMQILGELILESGEYMKKEES
ncbi:MAG: DUF1801 domain-containing protein [Candidatus Lokiarchaeota archaeon]|nr:DUF1801 domain-containing protein [Candidatus Lokiarchaeota archaeon]